MSGILVWLLTGSTAQFTLLYGGPLRVNKTWTQYSTIRRKIRFIESNAKCRHLKNLPGKGLWGRCLSALGSEPHTPPPYTLYKCIQYTYSHREGGGELNQREGERGNRGEYRSYSCVENTNMTECTQEIGYLQSTNCDKHNRKFPLQINLFGWLHFALTSMSLILLQVLRYYPMARISNLK